MIERTSATVSKSHSKCIESELCNKIEFKSFYEITNSRTGLVASGIIMHRTRRGEWRVLLFLIK